MKTPKQINHLSLIATCVSINEWKWDEYMEDTTKANGSEIRKHIKEHLPDLYIDLGLEFPNPYEHQCRKKKGLFVYVHSSVEYFLEFS